MSKTLEDMEFEKYQDGRIINNYPNRQKMKELLDSKGKGFCLAKWTQVTMHLGNGLTHSCHHPAAHKIPVEELKNNPGALHNTKFKKEKRKEMLNGERPSECDFCWRIEDNTGDFSDRVYKSLDHYSVYDHDKIKELTGEEDIFPRYVEISFSNVCNLKCAYCGPNFSSKWVEEINQHGVYTFPDGDVFNNDTDRQILGREDNPYTEAFWKWFPEAVSHMHTFRITGGEPLLSKHTMKVIDYLIANPQPNLEFAINSNANPPDELWKEFTNKINYVTENKCVKNFTLFTSAEGLGPQQEYARFGMDWAQFEQNIDYFLSNTRSTRVAFMSAFNIFSLPTFVEFLQYVLNLKKKYCTSHFGKWVHDSGVDTSGILKYNNYSEQSDTGWRNRVGIDTPYVRFPKFLDVNTASMELINKYLLPATNFMYQNLQAEEWDVNPGFETREAAKLRRIFVDVVCAVKDARNTDETTSNWNIAKNRAHFYTFVNEYDRRRNTNFLETFPEYNEFYKICELEHNKMYPKSDNEV